MFQQLSLDKKLKDYISKCLEQGNALSRHVVKKVKFENGTMHAALPQDFDLQNLSCYEHGGVVSLNSTQLLLTQEIKNYLKDFHGIVVFEDSLRKSTDLFILDNPDRLNLVVENQEIYYYLGPEDGTFDDKILSTIKRASGSNSTNYIGYFIEIKKENLSFQKVELLAKKISAIVFGAFDRESFLLWRKNN